MPALTPQPSINDARTQAMMAAIDRLGQIDLAPLLLYRIDSVPDSALPLLAWQFDVLSPLWVLAASAAAAQLSIDDLTDIDSLTQIDILALNGGSTASQRELLKSAIALHRMRGTPAAIMRALAALGWPSSRILEGQASWNGASWPASQGWAVCRVLVDLAPGQTAAGADIIIAAFNFYAPARAWLDSVWFVEPAESDVAEPTRDLGLGGILTNTMQYDRMPAMAEAGFLEDYPFPLTDAIGAPPIANGEYLAAGGIDGSEISVGVVDSGVVVNGVEEGGE